MSAATLNGHRVTACRVQMPAWGLWYADVEVESVETLTGSVTLVIEDLTLVGTVLTGGVAQARARYRIVAGAGGWGRTIHATSMANDLGVKAARVIEAAAAACGESVGTLPSGTVGASYVRAEEPAARVLDEVASRAWYVDEAGVTQFGRRAAVAYTGGATRTRTDSAQGVVELAPSALATLVPGAVVDGIEAVDVEHCLEGGRLRTTIWGRGIADSARLSTAFARIVETFTAPHRFYAPWEYRVVLRNGERLDLQCVRVSAGMPDLRNVRVRPGVAGMRAHPKLGSLVIVSFINGDQARPVVTGFDDQGVGSSGFIADDIYVQAGTTGAQPTERAASVEGVVNLLFQVLSALAAPLGGAGAVTAAFGTAFTAIGAGSSIATLKTALDTALAAKTANTSGNVPNLGWPNVRGG